MSISLHALNATHGMSGVLMMVSPASYTSPLHIRQRQRRGNEHGEVKHRLLVEHGTVAGV